MQPRDSGRVHDRLISRLDRQEKMENQQRDRFLRFKLPEIHNQLTQALLMRNIVETEKPADVSDAILKGLKKALRSTEFEFDYFIAPVRDLVPRPNPYALYMAQYIMEVLIDDPSVIEIYGTDLEIYQTVDEVITKINASYENAIEEVMGQMARDKSVAPGSREYDIALDQLLRAKFGEPLK